MKYRSGSISVIRGIITIILCISAILVAGCSNNIISYIDGLEKYERTIQLSAPFPAGGVFNAESHNGYINVTGSDTKECKVTAIITGYADTEQKAKKIADKVKVTLEPSGDSVNVVIDKPEDSSGQRSGVSFEVNTPVNANLVMTSYNGGIKINNINGRINAKTHNGSVEADNIGGGPCELESNNGSINAVYAKDAQVIGGINLVTHNGNIDLTTPKNFSANIDAATHNGSVSTNLPVTIQGEIDNKRVKGKIGSGANTVKLESHNGSVRIK
ncbi:MAG: DUF4097 family beta strand repeat-containing protein [Armatimonadota bacterium]